MGQLVNNPKTRQLCLLSTLVTLSVALWFSPAHSKVSEPEALWLSLAPAPAFSGPNCELHPTSPPPAAKKSKRGGRPAGGSHTDTRFENEHRPTPVRTYYLQGPLSRQASAYVLQADGSSKQLEINYDPQPSLTFKTPMADDGFHGANNIYVIDKQVENGVLTVQSAKWLAQAPLDIVINGLWDGNFHADVQSGNELSILVTALGQPVEGASVSLTTEKKWTHSAVTGKDGIAKIQLIKDYYPSGWAKFNRSQQSSFTVTAEYSKNEAGEYNDQPYQQVQYLATFPWKYTPARADYSSYAFGLGLGAFFMVFTGIGVYSFRERRKKPYKGVSLE